MASIFIDVYYYSLYNVCGIEIWTQIIGSPIHHIFAASIHRVFLIIFTSYISVSISNNIVFSISVKNINHMLINKLIIVVSGKLWLLCFHIMVKIKISHNYLWLNGFWWYNNNTSLRQCLPIDHGSSSLAIHYNIQ